MEIQTDNPEEGYPFPCYSYDDKKCVVLNTAYIMSSETLDPRYVLGILNSRLGKFLVKLYVTQLQERQFRMLSQYVMKFPIARPTREQEKEMTHLVQEQYFVNFQFIDSFIICYVLYTAPLTGTCTPVRQP